MSCPHERDPKKCVWRQSWSPMPFDWLRERRAARAA
jgi:hypothetical protein